MTRTQMSFANFLSIFQWSIAHGEEVRIYVCIEFLNLKNVQQCYPYHVNSFVVDSVTTQLMHPSQFNLIIKIFSIHQLVEGNPLPCQIFEPSILI